jgi:hypothetical protein
MTVRLENLTSRPVTLVLNSGAVVHLPPGHAIEPEAVEIEENAKVQKLSDALVIAVAGPDDAEYADEPNGRTARDVDDVEDEAEASTETEEPPVPSKPTKARPRRRPADDKQ